jgi:exonuclease III
MMKIVSWNCRGLDSSHKKEDLKKLLHVEKPSILMLQETKLGDLETLNDLQKNWNYCDGRVVSSIGASGGIRIFWKRANFDLQSQVQTQFWIRVNLLNKISGMLYSIINVYILNNYNEKIECWQSLIDLDNGSPLQNLIITGDFKTTRAAMQKRGGSIVRDQFRERLEDLISDLNLYDVPSSKGIYPWNNRRAGPGHTAARLDRFLISSDMLAFPEKSCSMNLPWAGSDHHPIRLTFEKQQNWGPIPFKLNPLWLDRPEILQSIAQIWNQWIT